MTFFNIYLAYIRQICVEVAHDVLDDAHEIRSTNRHRYRHDQVQ
jgi:hypothetical protein